MGMHVLIVDDHAEFRGLARAMFEAAGFTVDEARDAASAAIAVAEHRPDVVLLDVYLPDANGFDLAGSLTQPASGPAVVMTSSHDADDFGRRVSKSGARGFIAKSELTAARLVEALG